MAGTLTGEDFTELRKHFLTREDFAELSKRFVTNERFEAVTQALKNRIDQMEVSITTDITGAIDQAMRDLVHRAELENLKTRVDRLEQKVG